MLRISLSLLAFLALVAAATRLGPDGGASDELTIVLHRDGTCLVDGRSLLFDGLVERLAVHADVARDESHPYQVSERRVRILAEPGTLWGPVLDALIACSAPEVRIWRVRVGRLDSTTTVALPLDRDRMTGWEYVRREEVPTVLVTLKRGGGSATGVKILDHPLGIDEEGFRLLARSLREIADWDPDLPGRLRVLRHVSAEQAIRAYEEFRTAGFAAPWIEGAPPVSWRAGELRRAARELPREELLGWIREGLVSRDPEEHWTAARLLGGYGEAGIPVVVDALDGVRDRRLLRALRAAAYAIRGSLPVDVDLRGLLAAVARAEARLGPARTRFDDGPVIR